LSGGPPGHCFAAVDAVAKPRKQWSELSASYRDRLARHYASENGWTRKQTASRFNRGTLPDRRAARGHEVTAEHGGGRIGGKTLPVLVRNSGQMMVEHLNRREVKLIAQHWNWINHFLRTGEETMWSPKYQREYSAADFETKTVGEDGRELETSLDAIEYYDLMGGTDIEGSFEDFYEAAS
jgi:hypothetical protein